MKFPAPQRSRTYSPERAWLGSLGARSYTWAHITANRILWCPRDGSGFVIVHAESDMELTPRLFGLVHFLDTTDDEDLEFLQEVRKRASTRFAIDVLKDGAV